MYIKNRDISMPKGWIAVFKDESVICEDDMVWNKVPNKKNICQMILKWEDRLWDLTNKECYTVPNKRGYVDVNSSSISQGIHSRTIGYYDLEEKCKVFIRVDEVTGQMQYETESFK